MLCARRCFTGKVPYSIFIEQYVTALIMNMMLGACDTSFAFNTRTTTNISSQEMWSSRTDKMKRNQRLFVKVYATNTTSKCLINWNIIEVFFKPCVEHLFETTSQEAIENLN